MQQWIDMIISQNNSHDVKFKQKSFMAPCNQPDCIIQKSVYDSISNTTHNISYSLIMGCILCHSSKYDHMCRTESHMV